ncbi:antitoxin [Bosea sp. WAO]|uniref:type II toxin-antitoxin system ParD family antitoxin n=1 Tax=Bosea sp. WAO TaxID=406341 RepID=UPI0007482347|nr:type II toxin-antitoxin system ParD family antitoxin [Bosea sp. WAO]KUL96046.1 antitoxin [Bosea sp. WAO]
MATMNISLPASMKEWAEAQTETGRYANTSDYVRDLIRRDQDRNDKIAAMQRFVDEGVRSGAGTQSSDALFATALKRTTTSPGNR